MRSQQGHGCDKGKDTVLAPARSMEKNFNKSKPPCSVCSRCPCEAVCGLAHKHSGTECVAKLMNKTFLPNSRKALPTFRTFCTDGVRSAHMGSLFAHFQVQALLAVRYAVTMSLHAVKLLYTATFQWGLKVCSCFEGHRRSRSSYRSRTADNADTSFI